jgi:sugar/nucleoside kinase (ribokinase family)
VAAPDLVTVGHVTLDRIGDTTQPGGAALYAAVAAHRLGLSVGILTSHADDFPLDAIPPRIEVVSVPAGATTTFEHDVRPRAPRAMRVPSVARALTAADVPEDWSESPLVLLAPVANEVDSHVATAFTGPTLAAAAQGWMRALGPEGVVGPTLWTPPDFLLGRLQSIFVSTEDVAGYEDAALEWFQRVPIGVLTAGRAGALLFVNGERYEVPPRPTTEVDATGAGDVFAAAFLIHYQSAGDPWEAAAAASCAASLSVEASGIAGVPDRATLEAALREHLREA